MSDGDDRNDKLSVVDLVNDAVVTDPDAPGLPTLELFATRRAGIIPQFHHLIFDPGGNGIG
jgi:hypothetical protein